MTDIKPDTIQRQLGLTPAQSRYLADCINGDQDISRHPVAQDRIRECYHRPWDSDMILTVANVMMRGHGVEGEAPEDGPCYSFVNMGDSYVPTLCVVADGWNRWNQQTFHVACWADLIDYYVEGE